MILKVFIIIISILKLTFSEEGWNANLSQRWRKTTSSLLTVKAGFRQPRAESSALFTFAAKTTTTLLPCTAFQVIIPASRQSLHNSVPSCHERRSRFAPCFGEAWRRTSTTSSLRTRRSGATTTTAINLLCS